VYAAITEAMTLTRRRQTRDELRAIVAHEWPIVEVAVLPAVIMALSVAGALNTQAAINVALGVCLVELAATGVIAAARTGARGWTLVLLGGASVALGLAVVALKTLTH
jgi:energy-converting hydrogenase Eha subunit H